MSNSTILMAEFLKTKRTATRRIAIASPLCLALMAIVQQGYFSLNLFNWYYVVFLPATFALISATAVNIDNGKHGLRAIRCLPVSQGKIWSSKLLVVLGYALLSCFLLSVAVVCIPFIFSLFGINQIKQLSIASIFLGIIVVFVTTMWQIPFSFIISKKLGGYLFGIGQFSYFFFRCIFSTKTILLVSRDKKMGKFRKTPRSLVCYVYL